MKKNNIFNVCECGGSKFVTQVICHDCQTKELEKAEREIWNLAISVALVSSAIFFLFVVDAAGRL